MSRRRRKTHVAGVIKAANDAYNQVVAPRRRRRRAELQEQLHAMEEAIDEETLPDEPREWRRQFRAQRAAIRREARRRLGLPDEEG